MKRVENSKGFLIAEMTADEAYNKGCGIEGGIEGGIVCCHCNKLTKGTEKCFYVACLNDFMCEDCYNKWYKDATYYPEDAGYERKNMEYMESDIPKGDHKVHIYEF